MGNAKQNAVNCSYHESEKPPLGGACVKHCYTNVTMSNPDGLYINSFCYRALHAQSTLYNASN